MTTNVELKITGFNPDEETRSFISLVSNKLHFSAPSDSGIKLAIKKGQNAIQASCRIASQAGIFFAESTCESAIEAVQQIEQKLKIQLDEWKLHRFDQIDEGQVKRAV